MRKKTGFVPLFILFVLWGYGVFDSHWGESSLHLSNDLPENALLSIDRSLRLSSALADQPRIVRWMLSGEFKDELKNSREVLKELEKRQILTEAGESALSAVEMELGLAAPPPLGVEEKEEISLRLNQGKGTWWDAALVSSLLQNEFDAALQKGLVVQAKRDLRMVQVNAFISGVLWLMLIVGIAMIPSGLRSLRTGWRAGCSINYSYHWHLSRVLAVFFAVNLLADYLLYGLYLSTISLDTGFVFDAVADSLWRLIPPALALALFFRRPRHAFASLGIDRRPAWGMILAVLALLQIIDITAYEWIGRWLPPDLSDQPDPVESGAGGLVYALLSACVFAPVSEEIIYRGILLRGLERRLGFAAAALISTAAFALGHTYDVYGMMSVAIFGFSAAIVYRATQSLTTVIVLHALYNLTITFPEWIFYHSSF